MLKVTTFQSKAHKISQSMLVLIFMRILWMCVILYVVLLFQDEWHILCYLSHRFSYSSHIYT